MRAADAKIDFSGDDNHLFFQLGERLLISRKLTGNFPDFDRVLPKEQPNSVDALARRDASGDRTCLPVRRRALAVRFGVQVAPGEVKYYSSLSETGESEESLRRRVRRRFRWKLASTRSICLDFLRALPEARGRVPFQGRRRAPARCGRREMASTTPTVTS